MPKFLLYLPAIAWGIVDFDVKALYEWQALPEFVQGWSWHIFIFICYLATVWFVVWLWKKPPKFYLAGMLLFVNEDVTFYILKSLALCEFWWNSWLFPSLVSYIGTVIFLNLMAYLLIKEEVQL